MKINYQKEHKYFLKVNYHQLTEIC